MPMYQSIPTLKTRTQDIEDWLLLLNAVIRLKPSDIPVRLTIDHSTALYDAAKASLDNLRKEGVEMERERIQRGRHGQET